MVLMFRNGIVAVIILQVILLLSNVNESQGGLLDLLGPIFGFPPSTPPGPSPTKPPRPAGLKDGFYLGLCPNKSVDIEAEIKVKVREEFGRDPTIVAAFLRMQFHDCFVRGCDASLLIDGDTSEKKADANLSVRGYEFIDTLKSLAEARCPGLVSCADLIAIVTAESLKMGGGPNIAVQTGRCDGLRSNMGDVDLPSPSISVPDCIKVFDDKNFSPEEMVILFVTHSVGIAHCVFFQDRLYSDKTQFDPLMDLTLRSELTQNCPHGMTSNNFTFLDQNPTSSNKVDTSYYEQLTKRRGILPIDQALFNHPATSAFVTQLALNPNSFNPKLGIAMLKLQALNVLTGSQGEVRKNCRKFNN